MPRCLIGLGSNLGNRRANIEESLEKLRAAPGVSVTAVSSLRETIAAGGPADQSLYLNAAAVVDCTLQARELLVLLQRIETELGRMRVERWGPRVIDLDLLLYGDAVISLPDLQVPHPRMAWRRFVLEPAAEVAGEMLHPIIGWTIARLLEHLNTALPYTAVAGPIAVGKSRFARLISEKTSARLITERIDETILADFYSDPAGKARLMELEFIRRRKDLLTADGPDWHSGRSAVSDFWFDQSLAHARQWLYESQQAEIIEYWREARKKVAAPKLIVILDAPTEMLLDRIRRRGRRGEEHLTLEQLERIRRNMLDQASQPGLGPVLMASGEDIDSALTETLAAVQAMR
jgi:2-amino-4-hydroxy-6-hydroxymethyldihydropteridine diphosphokinase